MTVTFNRNAYRSAIQEEDKLKDDLLLFNYAKSHPQFIYGQVSYKQFAEKYKKNQRGGWIGRKIIAIPAALFAGVIKTTYHFATAIIFGIPKARTDRGRFFRGQIFSLARDFQEALGQLMTLFNDTYGQFHVQESQFHKTCYDCFSVPKNVSLNQQSVNVENNLDALNGLKITQSFRKNLSDFASEFQIKECKILLDVRYKSRRFIHDEVFKFQDNQEKLSDLFKNCLVKLNNKINLQLADNSDIHLTCAAFIIDQEKKFHWHYEKSPIGSATAEAHKNFECVLPLFGRKKQPQVDEERSFLI